jgi:excisionase family DNA binding protein
LFEESRLIMKRPTYADLKYSIRILNNGDGTYSVEVPKLPGCYSSGRSKSECLANVVEAIELHIEGLEKAPFEDRMPAIEVVPAKPHADDYLISLSEACRFLGVSDATIRRYIRDGRLPAYNFRKEYKFKIQDLSAFIESHRVTGKPDKTARRKAG